MRIRPGVARRYSPVSGTKPSNTPSTCWKKRHVVAPPRSQPLGVRARLEPIYYKGELVGHVRKYSDALMMFLLKAHRPDKYRDNIKVDHAGARISIDTPAPVFNLVPGVAARQTPDDAPAL